MIPEQQARKEAAEKLRAEKKARVDMASIREHEQKVLASIEAAEAKARAQAKLRRQQNEREDVSFPKSAFFEHAARETQHKLEEEQRRKRELAERKERQRKYADLVCSSLWFETSTVSVRAKVREMFPPATADATKPAEVCLVTLSKLSWSV